MNSDQLYVKTRKEWREWLRKNYNKKNEIWLIYYKKHTGKPRIPYDDAVEEALCYGWIDSTVKRVDEEIFIQKFTPRNKKSVSPSAGKDMKSSLSPARTAAQSGAKTTNPSA